MPELIPVSSLDDALASQREKFEQQIESIRNENAAKVDQLSAQVSELSAIRAAFVGRDGKISREAFKKMTAAEYMKLRNNPETRHLLGLR